MSTVLELKRWVELSSSERQRCANQIADQTLGRFQFDRLQRFSCGNVSVEVAAFTDGDSRFVLVPGGTFKLGFDPDHFRPSPGQQESYRCTAEEFGMGESLIDYIVQHTTPIRTVKISPLLVEVAPRELGLVQIPLDTPAVQEVIRRQKAERGENAKWGYEVYRQLRVTHLIEGTYEAYGIRPVSHTELVAEMASEGFRLPSSDEWEFLCGGSSRTLFRWGDDCPCDRYPTDISPEESLWRKMWVVSGGTLEAPAQPFKSDWNQHVLPNAFGLSIAFDPYQSEAVSEPTVSRGGDGGSMICGGAGFFVGWLPIATAFLDPNLVEYSGNDVTQQFGRRVLPLE